MRSRRMTVACVAASAAMALTAGAVTLVTETSKLSFQSPTMDTYATGFANSQRGNMVVSNGQAHLVATYDANHMERLQYRRFDPDTGFTGDWAGPAINVAGDPPAGSSTLGYTNPFVTVDGSDRVSIVYQYREDTTYTWYQTYCENASTSAPLNADNWSTPTALGVPAGGSGDLISVGSDTLLLAQYRDGSATPDGYNDITIEKGVWNGSGYTWTSLGVALESGYSLYGGLRAPNLTFDGTTLHMSLYSAESGLRGINYAQSDDPLNPTAATWSAREALTGIDATYKETNGGVGVITGDTVVALVWAAGNRDGGPPYANFTRTRTDEGWGDWEEAFVGDMRYMPTAYGAGSNYVATAFAPDGMGGLFAVYDKDYISHYDPATGTWSDVFTGIPQSGNSSGNIEVVFGGTDAWSRVYHFSRANNTLYVGYYYAVPEPATASVLLLGAMACLRRQRRRHAAGN